MAKKTNTIEERATKRAEEKLSFLYHLVGYVIVNLILVSVNLLTSPNYLWSLWSIVGWGVGLLIHGVVVFLLGGMFENLRDKWTQDEIENLKKKKK